jgi:hypothetical protein
MSAAGLSSVYICSHLLGFTAQSRDEAEEDDGLPPALTRVETEEEKRKAAKFLRPTSTSRQMMESTQALGNAWFNKNFKYDIEEWTHYYMYAFERYKAFQDLTQGRTVNEPDWYNQGVEYLQKTQLQDGSWKTEKSHGTTPFVDTAFAVLFLTRSSQKSIKKMTVDEGILIGGKGLPKNLANARVEDGQVVTPQMVRDVDDLIGMLKDVEDMEFDPNAFEGVTLEDDLTKRNDQLARLRELVTHPDYRARLPAIQTLSKERKLDNVPALLYALSDPDPGIVILARDGLRFMSRKFRGFGIPLPPADRKSESAMNAWRQRVAEGQEQWTKWYRAIRPDAELLN